MATSPEHPHDPESDNLDSLIGGLELEAARRRADPGFPLDEDARLSSAFDAVAPRVGQPSARALAAAVVAAAPQPQGDGPGSRPGGRLARAVRPVVDERLGDLRSSLRDVAVAAADAVHVALRRLDALDGRVDDLTRLVSPASPPSPASPALPAGSSSVRAGRGPGDGVDLSAWHPQICAELAQAPGRVLYSGPDADVAVAALVKVGADAYGITTIGDHFRADVDVRFAGVLDHLGSVGTATLSTTVVAGALESVTAARLDALVAQLARISATVMVVSPSPWWWRQQLGAWASDVAVDRPLSADTWLEALAAVGFVGRGEFDELGHSYRVVASRR